MSSTDAESLRSKIHAATVKAESALYGSVCVVHRHHFSSTLQRMSVVCVCSAKVYMHTYARSRIHVYICTYMYTFVRICIHMYVHVYICTYVLCTTFMCVLSFPPSPPSLPPSLTFSSPSRTAFFSHSSFHILPFTFFLHFSLLIFSTSLCSPLLTISYSLSHNHRKRVRERTYKSGTV